MRLSIGHQQRKSTMMKKEYPQKVSLVGCAHQVRVEGTHNEIDGVCETPTGAGGDLGERLALGLTAHAFRGLSTYRFSSSHQCCGQTMSDGLFS